LIKANVAGGIFVAITFIIDVFKKISQKCFRLIALTDEGSLRIPDHYVPVLENLIDKVRDFPFYIDIIRLNIDDPREDLKLMKLARRCNGDIHEINDIRSLSAILEVLAIKREIHTGSMIDDDIDLDITEEDQLFFENLADEPIEVKNEETCSVCFQKSNKGLVKCPACETIAHKSCWSQWAKSAHIGILHLFRCHNCYNLIKLEPEYVAAVQMGKVPSEEKIEVESQDLLNYLRSLEVDEGPKIIQVEDPMALSADDYDDIQVEIEFDESTGEPTEFEALSDDELKIIWCPNCNKITTNEYKVCPNCKFPLDSVR
ncbi:MAG: hypothetical protein ACTSQJ_12600, partial [Promethearchaeota archaeon]